MVVFDTGEDGGLVEIALFESLSFRAAAAAEEVGAVGLADVDVAFDVVEGFLVDDWADVGARFTAVAEFEGLCLVDQHAEEAVVDSFLENEAAGGGAALAGGAEGAPECAIESQVEIGVIEDDLGVFAAHFEGEAFVEAAAGLADEGTCRGGSGERDQADIGVFDQWGADIFAAAVDEVDDVWREAGLEEDFNEKGSRVGDVFGWFEDDGVSANECGEHFPRRDGKGEVEGADEASDADGAAVAHGPFASQLRWDSVTEKLAALSGGVVGGVDPFLDVATGFGERLAHFAGHGVGDVFFSCGEEIADFAKDVAADWGWGVAPIFERVFGAGDGAVDVGGIGEGELANDVGGVGGVSVFEILTGGGFDPGAADEVLEDFHYMESGLDVFVERDFAVADADVGDVRWQREGEGIWGNAFGGLVAHLANQLWDHFARQGEAVDRDCGDAELGQAWAYHVCGAAELYGVAVTE